MKRLKAGRVALSKQAIEDLNSMIDELKKDGPYMRGGPSDFASSVISEFKLKYFEKEKGLLKKKFFDNKSYAKDRILKSKSDDDFYEELRAMVKERDKVLKKSRSKGVSGPPKTQEKEADS